MGMDLYCYEIKETKENDEDNEIYIGENISDDNLKTLKANFPTIKKRTHYEAHLNNVLKKFFKLSDAEINKINFDDLDFVFDVSLEKANKFILQLNPHYHDLIIDLNLEADTTKDDGNKKRIDNILSKLQTEIDEYIETVFEDNIFGKVFDSKFGKTLLLDESFSDKIFGYSLEKIERNEIGYMRKPFRHYNSEEHNTKDTFVVGNFSGVKYDSISEVFEKETIHEPDSAYVFIDFNHANAIDILAQFIPEYDREYFLSLKPKNHKQVVCIDW